MRHFPNHNSRRALDARWRDLFDITESQASVVIALIAAHNIGLGPVTSLQLEQLVIRDTAHKTGELQRMRLIECVGFAHGRAKLWRATATAYRRFELPVPELPPIVETAVSRAEVMQSRYVERHKLSDERRYRRVMESA